MSRFSLLKQFVETPGVPGREHLVRKLIRETAEASNFFDEIAVDNLGNLLCLRRALEHSKGPTRRILIAAHMDQTGFLVSHVAEDGTLRLHPVGTFDLRSLGCQPVWVVSEDGDKIPGTIVLAAKPIHTADPVDIDRKPMISDFYIDLTLAPNEVKKRVRLGDMVAFRTPFEETNAAIIGSALDDRIGCWAMIEALKLIKNKSDDLYFAFTVQEELGSRGAGPVSFAIKPDIGIVCETVVSCEIPGIPKPEIVTKLGNGIAIQIADSSIISDSSLVACAEEAAKKNGCSLQRCLLQGGGQDGALIQRSREGTKTIAFGCPVKFMHTVREHAHKEDVLAYPPVIAALLNAI